MATPAPSRWPRPTVDEMVCLVAGLFLTLAYAWLLDDAYIYFKYVDNWVLLGRGLVYNPGEYAEGFTSPLWLLILAALRRVGLGYWTIVRGVGLLSFIAFWWGCILIHRRWTRSPHFRFNEPLILLSLNYAMLSYWTSGTESPLVALAAVAYALSLVGSTSRLAQATVGLSPLIRPELGLAWLLASGFLTWTRRRPPWLVLIVGVGAQAGWLLFRALYYADLFPTTFYLKVRASPWQGLLYLHDAFRPYDLYFFAALGLSSLVFVSRSGGEAPSTTHARGAMLVIAVAMAVYVVSIGGDARHFRYLAFPIALGALACGGLVERAFARWPRRPPAAALPVMGIVLAFYAASGLPRQAAEHPLLRILSGTGAAAAQPLIIDRIADAEHHRLHPELPTLPPWGSGDAIELRTLYDGWRRGGDPPRAVNAEYLCWYHYRHFDQWSVHGFGLTDMILARTRGDARPDDRPGHRMALLDRAREEAAIVARQGLPPRAGVHRSAVEAGVAPPWVQVNLPVIEGFEKKVYGPRGAWESLRLATQVSERIDLDAAPPVAPATAR